MQLWNLLPNSVAVSLVTPPLQNVVFSDDGTKQFLQLGVNNYLLRSSLNGETLILPITQSIMLAAFSQEGQLLGLATFDNSILVIDSNTGQTLFVLPIDTTKLQAIALDSTRHCNGAYTRHGS